MRDFCMSSPVSPTHFFFLENLAFEQEDSEDRAVVRLAEANSRARIKACRKTQGNECIIGSSLRGAWDVYVHTIKVKILYIL